MIKTTTIEVWEVPQKSSLPTITTHKCTDCKHLKSNYCTHPENVHYVYPSYGNITKQKMMAWTPQEKNSNGLCELFEPLTPRTQKVLITLKDF